MLRSAAIRLVLWLCRTFDIALVEQSRIAHGRDAISRGEQWEAFAREEGGLFDMIETARREAFEAYADCRPGDVNEKDYLAQQDRCWRQLEARVNGVIQSGVIEADNRRKVAATISPLRKAV